MVPEVAEVHNISPIGSGQTCRISIEVEIMVSRRDSLHHVQYHACLHYAIGHMGLEVDQSALRRS